MLLLWRFVKLPFELPMFVTIIFPSTSGKLTAVKCIGELMSLKLSKAEAIRLARCLKCQATAYLCIDRYVSLILQVSILYSLLSCPEKEGSVFVVSPLFLSFVSPRTPQAAYRPCRCRDRKALFLMLLTCPPSIILSFCAVFCTFTKCEGVGCDSLLTAWRVSLNIFRVFGDVLSLWQAGGK